MKTLTTNQFENPAKGMKYFRRKVDGFIIRIVNDMINIKLSHRDIRTYKASSLFNNEYYIGYRQVFIIDTPNRSFDLMAEFELIEYAAIKAESNYLVAVFREIPYTRTKSSIAVYSQRQSKINYFNQVQRTLTK